MSQSVRREPMMSNNGKDDDPAGGRGGLTFIVASVAVFLVIAGCVVYVVARLV